MGLAMLAKLTGIGITGNAIRDRGVIVASLVQRSQGLIDRSGGGGVSTANGRSQRLIHLATALSLLYCATEVDAETNVWPASFRRVKTLRRVNRELKSLLAMDGDDISVKVPTDGRVWLS